MKGFTKPQRIDIYFTRDNFDNLYSKYVLKEAREILHESITLSPAFIAKESFIPNDINRVNIDVDLNANKFSFVFFDLHIDMMGKMIGLF